MSVYIFWYVCARVSFVCIVAAVQTIAHIAPSLSSSKLRYIPTAVRDRDVNYISSHSTRDDKIIIIKRFIRGRTIYINISIRSVAAVTTCN